MKTPVIHLSPDESKLAWEVYRGKTNMDMSLKSGNDNIDILIGVITLPKLMPSEWPSELQEKLTKEEQEAIYEKIKNKDNASRDIVIRLNQE